MQLRLMEIVVKRDGEWEAGSWDGRVRGGYRDG